MRSQQSPLRRAGVTAIRGNILQPRSLACQKLLQNSLHLFLQGLMRELLRQFRLQLGRHHLQKIGIVGEERLRQVLAAKEQHVMSRPEFHRTREMVFIKPPVRFGALEFHAFRMDAMPYAPACDGHDPGKTRIDQRGRLRLTGQ